MVTFWGDYQYPKIVYTNVTSPLIYNNTFIGYRTLFRTIDDSDMVFENNVIPCIQWSTGSVEEEHHPLLINNCLAREILSPWDMIDGGINIVASPMLADSLNGDYSLSADSPCIDSGAFRPDLPQFDIMYNKRIVSGTGSGQQTIDIGAYEYNSSYIGGLRGVVYNPDSGEMIDCAKIGISQKLPEFSDIVGSFVYPTGPGVYTVRASRWDYEDQVIENVVVNEGEVVELTIPMHLTSTDIDDPVTPPMTQIKATNYPNPFNPETTISFFLPEAGITELCIYNLKGQMIRRMINAPLSVGTHRLVWDGKDERNTPVASGMYLYRLQSGKHKFSGKMVLAK